MFSKPSTAEIARFVSFQAATDFSYAPVGATLNGDIPAGYNIDHSRIRLGEGEQSWRKAVQAIERWQMFRMHWLQLCWPHVPIQPGTTVAILIHHFGFWSLNASRIVRVIQESGVTSRFGFAYGTLWEHSESGEERFSVEWHKNDDSVWYDLLAFSRPRAKLARIGFPFARMLQHRFVVCSQVAMCEAVS